MFFVQTLITALFKKINIDSTIKATHDRNSLQQAQITELTETTFNVYSVHCANEQQQQSFRPLADSIVD